MNSNLSWEDHISHVSRKIFGCLRSLWTATGVCNVSIKKRMFMSYIFPHFLYCSNVIFGMSAGCRATLQKCFNAGVRFVYGLRKYDHISLRVNEILGCSITEYLEFRLCFFFKKLLSLRRPEYLFEKLVLGRNFQGNFRLIPSESYFVGSHGSVFVRGVRLWNSLPLSIKSVRARDNFFLQFLEWRRSREFYYY